MAKVMIGNASAITVPREDRAGIRRFYCDVLGGKIVKADNEKDILRLEEDFYIVHRYGDVPDASEFLRSPRALWLQIKTDNVEEMTRKILEFGARKLDLPSGLPESVPYLYFQAPGEQCFQLLPINENQSYYKGKRPELSKRQGGRGAQGESDERVGLSKSQEEIPLRGWKKERSWQR